MSHEYNTRILYKVTLQVNKYRRLKQRLTCRGLLVVQCGIQHKGVKLQLNKSTQNTSAKYKHIKH